MTDEDRNLFKENPRNYALKLVEDSLLSNELLALVLLKYMSYDDVRGALDANELSPRFFPPECSGCGDEVWEEDEDFCEECR
tara:strand:- start:325 stop:570 length:246 start_codon:yes stop_codon:yes gene_type:complete